MKKRRIMQETTQNPLKEAEEFRKALKKKFDYKQKVKRTMLGRDSQEFLDALNGNVEQCDIELEMQQKLTKVEAEKLKDQEKIVRDIKKWLFEEQQKLQEDEQSLRVYQKEEELAEVKRWEACNKLAEFKRMQVEFSRTILIHGSATKRQMLAYTKGKIVSTNRDKEKLEEAGIIIDEIFNSSKAEHLITYIPVDIADKYKLVPDIWNGIIDYCEMIANFKMAAKPGEEEKIVILYSNWEISQILKANGFE